MIDKVQYWLDLCDDNLITAKWLLEGKRYLDMGFFCHQIAEKALKAAIEHNVGETPPKIHDLRKLAVKSKVYDNLSERQLVFLEDVDPLQIEARYPETKKRLEKTLSNEICTKMLKETEEFLCWIKRELGR